MENFTGSTSKKREKKSFLKTHSEFINDEENDNRIEDLRYETESTHDQRGY